MKILKTIEMQARPKTIVTPEFKIEVLSSLFLTNSRMIISRIPNPDKVINKEVRA